MLPSSGSESISNHKTFDSLKRIGSFEQVILMQRLIEWFTNQTSHDSKEFLHEMFVFIVKYILGKYTTAFVSI